MATKNKTNKNKLVVQVEAKAFDLSGRDEKANEVIKSVLETLIEHPGWKFLVQVFQENVKALENAIIDGSGNDKIDDEMRMKRKYLIELMGKPQVWKEKLERGIEVDYNPDPYYSSEDMNP